MTADSAGQGDASFDAHLQSVVDLSRKMLANVMDTAEQITQINRATRILSMNARVEAARAGAAGAGFGVVAEELTRLSGNISAASTQMLEHSKRLNADLDDMVANLSDRVRDVRERSCDVRCWATDAIVCGNLATMSRDVSSRRLSQILDFYSGYLDLVVVDLQGCIVANGRAERYRIEGTGVAESEWFQSALADRDGAAHPSSLASGQRVLIYSCVIREGGAAHGRPIGVLGALVAH